VTTRPLADLRAADEAQFGGKSASLGELIAAGLPVPPGFAVISSATEADLDEVAARYVDLGEPPVAVRSSAIGEDSGEATFAGQQDTYLWVRGIDRVGDAVRDCWASIYNPEAIAYRERIGHEDPAMAVTVQSMVDAEISGVMFTCSPVSGDRSLVAVNASWGLGLAVVGGEVTPDEYRVSKVTHELLHKTISPKHVEYVSGPEGAVEREVEAERQEVPCLDEERLGELVEVGKRVERHFGAPQDIEWAIARDSGELLVLQSRPVTAVPAKKEPPKAASAMDMIMGTFGVKRD
jgi:phosphoenolpyruvate synthase/pyruvate phosphate dikinase